ncbi:fructokinase [Longilinea arvoryzae]|uniref:fructokinase n=1 Tax=Longilinea arvoryzae TaxID=360412 RepID=A0A0S7BBD5_9CHLR|nr:ROK family protein [Longilinea arvoryzae]GAP14967.1 fructokinase [Longilinea arvoryzae]
MGYFGGVEAGGTKFVCIVTDEHAKILAETRFPTTQPEETLQKTADFFTHWMSEQRLTLEAIGVASFGPVDLNTASETWGFITSTPKPGWRNTPVTPVLEKALGVPVFFDTDVNGAALGEGRWGAAQGLSDFVYLTIGTGIGGGVVCAGKPLHGLVHPEMGHIYLPHDRQADPFDGCCPYHRDCFEGLASGPALNRRWGVPAEKLPPDHPAWELEAHIIALALSTFICTLSPQRIILGGGVMAQHQLFPMIRKQVVEILNGYVQSKTLLEETESYIVSPGLGNQAGSLGAIALALRGS